jgi:glutamyl-Q tRNA(Asp) synthetase
VAALASWLDARAHGGTWLVRIEDVDSPRCPPGADAHILHQLACCGLVSDEPVVWQSQRSAHYQQALAQLQEHGHAYPCGCSRKDLAAAATEQGQPRQRHQAPVYPGTCRPERGGLQGRPARAWRLALPPDAQVHWTDRRLGPQTQNVQQAVGDFVLRRADGLWAYQLAVVVDDAAQGISHVVRGEDLADNTPRQQLLQQALGLPPPQYLHTPLVLGDNGEKLSKQNGAAALDLSNPLAALHQAAHGLHLPRPSEMPSGTDSVQAALAGWVRVWAARWS